MNVATYIPSLGLRAFVRSYKFIHTLEEQTNRVLPGTGIAIAFRLTGQIGYEEAGVIHGLPSTVISGLRRAVRMIKYANDTLAVIVEFTETGAAAFFKAPLHELFGNSYSLEDIITPRAQSLIEEQLAAAVTAQERVAIIESFLISRLFKPVPDKLIEAAVHQIKINRGNIRVKALADTLYISQDAFEKRFRKATGASAKQFASIIRLKSLIGPAPYRSLTDLAYEAGYYDQPHFNKDFKQFTGLAPADFFKSAIYW